MREGRGAISKPKIAGASVLAGQLQQGQLAYEVLLQAEQHVGF